MKTIKQICKYYDYKVKELTNKLIVLNILEHTKRGNYLTTKAINKGI